MSHYAEHMVFTPTHGLSHTPIYGIWANMTQRCRDRNHKSWPDYGGRGIRVCDEWASSFETWFEDIGQHRPDFPCHLDRIDNDGDYEPGNVRWVPFKESMRNRRSCVMLTIRGETKTLTEWCEHPDAEVNRHTAGRRLLSYGYSPEDAVFLPKGRRP